MIQNTEPAPSSLSLPLIISVTGHRDLLAEELPALREAVQRFFTDLSERYPGYELTVLDPLASGADQLVAAVAIELGLRLIVPLPKPLADYRADIEAEGTLPEFDRLLERAATVLDISPLTTQQHSRQLPPQLTPSAPYANLGIFLSSHCHVLLAIWDGKRSDEIGGTSQVVQFHHEDYMPGFTEKNSDYHQRLADDESDLVYHICCSRDRPDGAPPPEFKPLDWYWFTKDIDQPLSKELPEQHARIFQRGEDFSEDANRFAERILAKRGSLILPGAAGKLPPGIENIDHLFSISDWLAIHYKKLSLRALLLTHSAAFLMGLMFLMYSDFETNNLYLIIFVACFALAAVIHWWSRRQGWTRKYLDYRTLAEGLRVQFYWAAAGITSEAKWRFAHDSYLQTQDPEFGWIRHVMRVAGTVYDAAPEASDFGLDYTIREWIGDGNTGQLGYYKNVATDRIQRDRFTRLLDGFSLLVSAVTICLFLLFAARLTEFWQTVLFLAMGISLLLYAIREGYAHSTAVRELIKQYEFMLRVFDNAHRRLGEAESQRERRQILLATGHSALEEHADWILMHRERSLDQREIWRMGN